PWHAAVRFPPPVRVPFSLHRHHSALFHFTGTAAPRRPTLSLHDALPISVTCWAAAPTRGPPSCGCASPNRSPRDAAPWFPPAPTDRKSTRLNSSHVSISYAVFCLKKKTQGAAISTTAGPEQ